MAAKGKISELYDIEAIKAQQQQAIGYVDEFVRKVSGTKPIKVQLEGAEKTKDMLKGMTDLGLATREYARILDNTATSQAKLSALQSDAAKKQTESKLAIQEQNKALKEEVQLNQAAEGSINQKRVQLAQLQRAYDALSAADRGSAEGEQLLKEIQNLDKGLKQLEGSTGRFQRNVGNYSGAVQTLEKALNEVKQKLDDVAKAGQQDAAVVETLQKEYQLLQTLVDGQSAGFKNATSEIRNNQQAILLLSQVYGEDSAVVQELITKTGKLTDTVADMRAEIKARASDTKVFDGLISAAQGLTGVYSIAQGLTAGLSDDTQDLQKSFVKLQAAMTVLQGLQAIQNVLQKESQARQLAAIALQKIANVQTTLQTAAESRFIAVRYAAVAAQKALNFAMSAAGGPILAVIGVIGLLLASFTSFGATTKDITIDVKKFGEEADLAFSQADRAQRKLAQSNAVTISQAKERFAADSEIRELERKGLQDQLKIQDDTINKLAPKEAALVKLQKDMREGRKDLDEQQFNDAKDILLKLRDARDKKIELEQQLNIKENDNARAATVESAQIRRTNLDKTISDLNREADSYKRIASDETKTFDARIDASNKFYDIQREIIEKQKQQALDNPELKSKPDEVSKIKNEAYNKERILDADQAKASLDLLKQSAERERAARLAIIKTELEDKIAEDEVIANNEKKSFNDRLKAAYDAYSKRRQILTAQYQEEAHTFEIAEAEKKKGGVLNEAELFAITKKNATERAEVYKKYSADVNQLTIDYGQKQLDLYKVNQEQITALIEKENQKRADLIGTNQANAVTALNQQFAAGKLSVEKYNHERTQIEQQYSIESAQNEVRSAFAKVMATKDGTAERLAAEKELAEKTQALSEATIKKQIEDEQRLAEVKKQLLQEGFNLLTTIVDAQFDIQKNKLQADSDNLDKDTEKKIDAINRETISEQEKADKIAVINARAAAQKEVLDRKQRQVDVQKARFDKAVSIARIIFDTATAVAKALYEGGPIYAAVVGALGAVQLATAIATPIPQYAEGTDDAPGGPAVVGDGGKREAVITPDGRVLITPDKPVVWDIPRHSVVLPDVKQLMDTTLMATHENQMAAMKQFPVGPDIGAIISKEFEKHGNRLVNAIMNKRENYLYMSNGELRRAIKNGNDYNIYLDENLNF